MALAAAAAATAATAALRSRASLGLSTWSCEQLRASFRCPRLLRAAVANGGLGSAQEAAHWGCHPHSLWPRPWGSSVSPTRPHPRETTGVFAQPSGTCSPLRTQSGLVHRAGIDLACGPCSSPVAPFLPLKQQSPRTSCYRTSLPWLPISANMWSDWNGQPQDSGLSPGWSYGGQESWPA
ncbi:zinc finger protein 90 homolog isoform X3 [Cervus elaphus]|uniref:zinc finger protein 90 homolog isoform X5 n=1 Tax=Cervus canadensis TaxID=1574408 RepID=UPI001CA3734F|nr:zinc finger protein 90 homolog isoform X5 [Cervus canadensis]XP_043754840.1 zinc finger protein 90 homolog isoform X3 [Cervus elaphus]